MTVGGRRENSGGDTISAVRRLIGLMVLMAGPACGSSPPTTGAAGQGGASAVAGHGGATATAGEGGAGAVAGHGGAGGSAGAGAAAAGPRVSDFLGLNGFIDDPTDKLAA